MRAELKQTKTLVRSHRNDYYITFVCLRNKTAVFVWLLVYLYLPCLWSLTLHLHGAQTSPELGGKGVAQKREEGEREEGVKEMQGNYRKIGVCSHHWPASHSPPSAAHSLGWQPAPCRSCWPLSPPGWQGRGEKQCETEQNDRTFLGIVIKLW